MNTDSLKQVLMAF